MRSMQAALPAWKRACVCAMCYITYMQHQLTTYACISGGYLQEVFVRRSVMVVSVMILRFPLTGP